MIEVVQISSTEQLIEQLNCLPNHFIYRGHASAKWALESSLERVIGNRWSNELARTFEEQSLRKFQSKFHLYDRENIKPDSKLAWLAMMQHYGVPTRLLDFTESSYVALYFALEAFVPRSDDDLAIYAVDYSALMEQSILFLKTKVIDFQETRLSLHDKQDKVFDEIVDRLAVDIAWTAEPKQLNVRLDRQAGTFLMSGNRGLRIEEVLNSQTYANVVMKKFVISRRLYQPVFALLRKMNITSKSLYGDLDGLARAVKMELQVYAFEDGD